VKSANYEAPHLKSLHFPLPRSSKEIHQSLKPCVTLCNMLAFYDGELLAPGPTSNLGNHPLSAVRYCLFNILAVILHIWRLSLPSAT